MTLYRQLLIWMLIVFFSLITSVFVIQFNTTRDYLHEQQSTELTNALSAVSLALSPYLEAKDYVSAESVIHATFDSSFYRQVKLDLMDTHPIIERTYANSVASVPNWFHRVIDIQPITHTIDLTSGWLQLGTLSVTSNPAYAYFQLWQAVVQLIIGFSGSFLLGACILAAILSRVLKPLTAIQQRAKAMSKNTFGDPLSVPRTRELADVVIAFNHMSAQLKHHFEQQAQEAERLRVRAFQDPVSGLANRSYLMTQLEAWLSRPTKGGVALLQADLIKDCYQREGYEAGDRLVATLAQRLKVLATDDFTIARLNQAEFMLLAPNTDAQELMLLGRTLLNISSELHSDPLDVSPMQAAVGLVMRREDDTISTLLAQVDNALMQARQQASDPLALLAVDQPSVTMGKQQWKQLVDEAIANHQIKLKFQQAIDSQGQPLHAEVFAYIEKGQQQYNAGQFIGALEQLDAGSQFDRHVLELIFQQLADTPELGPIAVNITQSSISDTGFIRWLGTKMKANPALRERILFELPEISFIKHSNDTDLLCEIIHQHAFAFGIDNFGHNFGSLHSLSTLRPAYVKLDFAYTNQIDDQAKADLLNSITRTTNNQGIILIASRVETHEQLDKLAALNVKGFQGFVVDAIHREKTQ